MHEVSVEQRFALPVARAWEVLCDVAAYPSAIESYVRVELEDDADLGVGSRWKQVRRVFGREHAQTMVVSVWEPPRLLSLVAQEGGAAYESRYEVVALDEADGGCLVKLTFTARPTNFIAGLFMRLLGAKMIASTGEGMAKDLAQLAAAPATTSRA